MKAVQALQEPDGAFHTVLDDRDTYLEMSATASLGYAALRGIRLGILDGDFRDMGERRSRPCSRMLQPDGIVNSVSGGTSEFIPYDAYNQIPISPRLYGQALTILLLVERLRLDE